MSWFQRCWRWLWRSDQRGRKRIQKLRDDLAAYNASMTDAEHDAFLECVKREIAIEGESERWITDIREWASSFPQRDSVVDDSRESIYGGRL